MKRSEALQMIIDFLEEDTDPKYVDTDYYSLANSLLNNLEREHVIKPWDAE